MSEKIGIIDLGSNTFHILVIEKTEEGQFQTIFKQRDFVALGEGGLGRITDAAFQRGIDTIGKYIEILDQLRIENRIATGTAAIRSASNGELFKETVGNQFDLDIEIISGQREASLIYEGVNLVMPERSGNFLIMDIGGGSVEFILRQDNKMVYSESFNIGIAHIYSKFVKNDPLTQNEISEIYQFLDSELKNLFEVLSNRKINALVGCSGSFEIIEEMIFGTVNNSKLLRKITFDQFEKIYSQVIELSYEERIKLPGLPIERAKLAVVAFVLIKYVLNKLDSCDILISSYALKEGLAIEHFKKIQ
ncbi:MAG TPA: hypothetical protein PK147_05640 [Saprospiraceae bacterium]|nr:hypothetical protein [Saprospiraceae bacterium]MCB9327496.1 hypothetical protein [Lewinellaceae bacterium]HPK10316.1 hypothetical protein [Saprospiraceae bacterium]HPQ21311.1 hypothetical protein [Saprospiraceae bacterium]